MLKAVGLIIIIIIYLSLSCDSAPSHQSKALCYSGSNLYQQIVQNCNQQVNLSSCKLLLLFVLFKLDITFF